MAIERGAGEVKALVGELIGMRAKGRRVSGKSDDLVLALSLAWWWVRKVEGGWKSGRIVCGARLADEGSVQEFVETCFADS